MRRTALLVFFVLVQVGCSHWSRPSPGIAYQRFQIDSLDAHVTRIDLDADALRIIVSDESRRGITVRELAERYDAIVAINGDYFDEEHHPVGLSIGSCGRWFSGGSARRQWVVGFAHERAEIFHPQSLEEPVPEWVRYAVSGWPLLVDQCKVIPAAELPGSDFFTRASHPRTAVGISEDGREVYLVVADGRREGVPGPTLEELGIFMRDELGVCSALNLDGGGSSEMVVNGVIVNQPSDGEERAVGNHVAVVPIGFDPECESGSQ